MKKSFFISFAFLYMALIIPMCNLAQASKKVIKETQVSSQNVHHLFNGKNLNGWYTFLQKSGRNNDPKKVFSVINGMIHIGGEEWGCITTNKEYTNYRLVAEFKWGGVKPMRPELIMPVTAAYYCIQKLQMAAHKEYGCAQ